MYAFLDRPVQSLNRGGQLLIWAMRHWVRAASAGRCPCGDIGPAFHKWNLMAGFPHFHMMMALLNRNATEKLHFGTLECEHVTEHEALLLSLIRIAREAPSDQLRGMATAIVDESSVTPVLIAFAALAEAMVEVGLRPLPPLFDPDRARYPI
ncbi:hypothetical protein FHS91_000408 [Sphingobium xanthum]|jgi:hypothetical protein|uniref:hypothetical protein n=1 Tax=Sphingobium xanthum TaxID=1387165 RepID=UPI001C8C3BED|nr:hypothetical protein [Sphingobium xanthum]